MNLNKTIIIAEIGVNHNGDILIAKKLIDIASFAGVDYVKFQTAKLDQVISKHALLAEYQKRNVGEHKYANQLELVKNLELSVQDHYELKQYCQQKDVKFLSSPFDLESIDLLDELNVDLFKIPSGEITNLPYLEKIASKRKPVILSTGMSDIVEIEEALSVLIRCGLNKKMITILHANTEYPTPFYDVNLTAMKTIAKKFDINVGYSDHTLGIEIPIAAVALGASIIEKHITLNREMEGPDHKASIEPTELIEMVKSIRNIEKALGDGIKKASPSEIKNISIARKSIIAKEKIKKGELFTENNLTVKRPGNGISPMNWYQIVGKTANREYDIEDLIEM